MGVSCQVHVLLNNYRHNLVTAIEKKLLSAYSMPITVLRAFSNLILIKPCDIITVFALILEMKELMLEGHIANDRFGVLNLYTILILPLNHLQHFRKIEY